MINISKIEIEEERGLMFSETKRIYIGGEIWWGKDVRLI
jgi:hypothetical protein